MKIVVLSDTHIPRTASDIPKQVYGAIKNADMVLHAGDIVDSDFLKRLQKMKKTVAVHGNMDSDELKRRLNDKEIVRAGKVKIGLIHGYGPKNSVVSMVRREFNDVQAIVFGHTHAPMNQVKDNILLFNPGSPTDKVFSTFNSYGILTVENNRITGEIVRMEDA